MEQVPSLLRDISRSLKAIAEKRQAEEPAGCVWVFTAEQTYDMENFDVVVRTFFTEEIARRFLHDFVYAPASDGSLTGTDTDEESLADFVEKDHWVVEYDEPDFYMAYPEGCYQSDHIECRITKCEIEK